MSELIPLSQRLELARQISDTHLKYLNTIDTLIAPVAAALKEPNPQLVAYSEALHQGIPPGSLAAAVKRDVEHDRQMQSVLEEPIEPAPPVEPTISAAPAQPQPQPETVAEEPKKRRGRPRKEEAHTPEPVPTPETTQTISETTGDFEEADLTAITDTPITPSQEEVIAAVEDEADIAAVSAPPVEDGDPDAAPVADIRAGLTKYLNLTDKKRMQTLRDALMEQHGFTSFSELEIRHKTRETILDQVKRAVEQAEGDDWSDLLS